jgi:tRNA dimethylallyltransferase
MNGAMAIVGTTASGKSALALELARHDATVELISVDSMQVYRGMDIGTAKPTAAEQAEVRHHLIDIADPDEDFTVARFQRAFHDVIKDIEQRGRRAVLVGGTGLYLRAVVDELIIPGQYPDVWAELDAEPDTAALHRRLQQVDPTAAARMEPSNRRRVLRALEVTLGSGSPFSTFGPGLETYPPSTCRLIGIDLPHDVVAARIERRFQQQIADGFVGEVATLAARPRGLSRTAKQALGYKELLSHLAGERTLSEALEEAARRTRRFARRQRSWFRRDARIEWLHADTDPLSVLPSLLAVLSGHT